MWVRALIICDDVRLESGGTVSLIGVFSERIYVPPGDGEIVLPRVAIYTAVAGLTEVNEVSWRQWLSPDGSEPGPPIAERRDPHDPRADEHRMVNIMSPLALPGAGRYRVTLEVDTGRERRTVDYHFAIERLARAS